MSTSNTVSQAAGSVPDAGQNSHDDLPFGKTVVNDLIAGTVVFLVALPLCLGIALASGAPLFSGLVTGIVGGIVVGALSGSRTSVSGPAAGLTAIVATQIAALGSFEMFLLAVVIAGLLQFIVGFARAGALAAFVPTSVINGLLAAIGVILILKQIPHLLGHDANPEGDLSYAQANHENTFSELWNLFQGEIHIGAVVIGLLSVAILLGWTRVSWLKKSMIPAALVVVLVAVGINVLFRALGGPWAIEASHLVQVPVAESLGGFVGFLTFPDFSGWQSSAVYLAAVTIALVASLETLLNIEAVDKFDPLRRNSPPNRELMAQGIGNMIAGSLGGLPMTSVIVRSSVNVTSGVRTKLSTIFHGVLLLFSVALLPQYLNLIPLSALAAILLVTGFKLASPSLFRQMAQGGKFEFIPFLVTLVAIVFTDLLIGILIGLAISIAFILYSSLSTPVRMKKEKHVGGEVTRIIFGNQVSFLNKASLDTIFNRAQRGTHLLLDATNSDYIDPDILALIRDFRDYKGPAHGVKVSFYGFKPEYQISDNVLYHEYATKELQQLMTPADVLSILGEGNQRFVRGDRLNRDLLRQMTGTSSGQHPYAVVLSCIDSRAPVETILDLGLGDIFSVRVAGNVTSDKVIGSMEYACAVAGAKLVVVLGHTKCGAVTSTVDMHLSGANIEEVTGCQNLPTIVADIAHSVGDDLAEKYRAGAITQTELVESVSRRNVLHSVQCILERSRMLRGLVEARKVAVVGAMYDVSTGKVEFFQDVSLGVDAQAVNGVRTVESQVT